VDASTLFILKPSPDLDTALLVSEAEHRGLSGGTCNRPFKAYNKNLFVIFVTRIS
jgi:hypothetical protein